MKKSAKTKSKQSGSKADARSAVKERVLLGDVIAIRLAPKAFAIGKVTFIAKKVKGLIVLHVFDKVFDSAEMPTKAPAKFVRPVWTGTAYIENGRWKKLGNLPLTKADEESSIYVTGTSLTHGETFLRKSNEADFEVCHAKVVSPMGMVESKLRKKLLPA
jgi:hypothetical protein